MSTIVDRYRCERCQSINCTISLIGYPSSDLFAYGDLRARLTFLCNAEAFDSSRGFADVPAAQTYRDDGHQIPDEFWTWFDPAAGRGEIPAGNDLDLLGCVIMGPIYDENGIDIAGERISCRDCGHVVALVEDEEDDEDEFRDDEELDLES